MSNKNSYKHIYLLFIPELNLSKIGVSKNVKQRIKQLQTGCPYQINLVKSYQTSLPHKIEKILHRHFGIYKVDSSDYNLTGEWFNLEINSIINFVEICSEFEKNINYLREKNNPFIK